MKNENWPSFLSTRHSIKPKAEVDPESQDYKGISENGVELARERAEDILNILEKEPDGSILFFLGSSEMDRTKSTIRAYMDEMKETLINKNEQEISLITKDEINNPDNGYTENANILAQKINTSPDKKFVVDASLFIKELGNFYWWTDKNGNLTEYVKKVLQDNNNNEELSFKDWLTNNGVSGDLSGISPQGLAEGILNGIKRLSDFTKSFLEDKNRNLIIGSVGHSWSLDALAIYLANDGVVDMDGFNKIKGSLIDETQILKLAKQDDGEYNFSYNDKEYNINNKE